MSAAQQKGTNIQSNNLRGTLSRDSFTRRTTSRATRTAYMQRHTSDILQERAYNERTTQTTVQFPTPTRRVLSDREPYATGLNPCLSRRVCLITRPFYQNISAEMIVMVVQPYPIREGLHGGTVCQVAHTCCLPMYYPFQEISSSTHL